MIIVYLPKVNKRSLLGKNDDTVTGGSIYYCVENEMGHRKHAKFLLLGYESCVHRKMYPYIYNHLLFKPSIMYT